MLRKGLGLFAAGEGDGVAFGARATGFLLLF